MSKDRRRLTVAVAKAASTTAGPFTFSTGTAEERTRETRAERLSRADCGCCVNWEEQGRRHQLARHAGASILPRKFVGQISGAEY
jgi:hypothetical protein